MGFETLLSVYFILHPSCDYCLKPRYDAINKMIGMLAEEITVNKGRAAYAGKVKAYCKTDLI